MPIESNCPSCGKRLRVAEEHSGKRARCPNCGEIYDVPAAAGGSPAASSAGPSEGWRIKTADGGLYGPATQSELDAWVAQGRVAASDQLQREGQTQWRPAADVYPTLTDDSAKPGPSSPFADARRAVANPYAPPEGGGAARRFQRPHRGGLILTLGIIGWFICCVFGIMAWAMGGADLRAMAAGQMDDSGKGLTMAGMIMGMIQVILTVIMFVVIFLFSFIGALAH